MNFEQRIRHLIDEIDEIKQPPTWIITILKVEEELRKYENGETVCIEYPANITTAWESENLSDYSDFGYLEIDAIKDGEAKSLTRIVENLKMSKETLVTFIPKELNLDRIKKITVLYEELRILCPLNIGWFDIIMQPQPHTTIKITDPMIAILGDFKAMCKRREKIMIDMIKQGEHPRTEEEAIEDALTAIYRRWHREEEGYQAQIAESKGVKKEKKEKVRCPLLTHPTDPLSLKQLRRRAEHKPHDITIDDVKNIINKIQSLQPDDIKIIK